MRIVSAQAALSLMVASCREAASRSRRVAGSSNGLTSATYKKAWWRRVSAVLRYEIQLGWNLNKT